MKKMKMGQRGVKHSAFKPGTRIHFEVKTKYYHEGNCLVLKDYIHGDRAR